MKRNCNNCKANFRDCPDHNCKAYIKIAKLNERAEHCFLKGFDTSLMYEWSIWSRMFYFRMRYYEKRIEHIRNRKIKKPKSLYNRTHTWYQILWHNISPSTNINRLLCGLDSLAFKYLEKRDYDPWG